MSKRIALFACLLSIIASLSFVTEASSDNTRPRHTGAATSRTCGDGVDNDRDGLVDELCHSTTEKVVNSNAGAGTNTQSSQTTTPSSNGFLARVAQCESSGNPRAVSENGAYLGKYQFSPKTWNSAASHAASAYVGVDPNNVPENIQDRVAVYHAAHSDIYNEWPVCSRR